jgi:cytochrome c peroxidase
MFVGIRNRSSCVKLNGAARALCIIAALAAATAAAALPNLFPFRDPSGVLQTYSPAGSLDTTGPFFQSLGTNGRTCATCHVPQDAFGLSAAHVQGVYDRTAGNDPLFAPVDGAVCQNQPQNIALLRHYGLFRIPLQLAANPQFTITAVHDPYGCALVTDPNSGAVTVSVYRRPLPATNLRFSHGGAVRRARNGCALERFPHVRRQPHHRPEASGARRDYGPCSGLG